MKTPFRLRRSLTDGPAVALLFEGDGVRGVLDACEQLGLDPSGRVFAVGGGLLLKLDRAEGSAFPGATRLRGLADNLFLPLDADLAPALLDDEAEGLTRDRGLVFLAGGVALGFDPGAPIAPASLLTATMKPSREWRPLPEPGRLAERIEQITFALPGEAGRDESSREEGEGPGGSPSPLAVDEAVFGPDGSGIGSGGEGRGELGPAATLRDRTAMGAGAWMIRLGRRLGSKGLAGMGARWVRAAMERAPRLGESAFGRQAAAMRELLRQFRQGDIEKALRQAPPFGAGGRGSKPMGGDRLQPRGLAYELNDLLGRSPRGPADLWIGHDDVAVELAKEYRKAAEAALARGDHRRAAAIYGKLLGDYRSAAQALLRGGLYRDAAAIYLARLDDPRAAAMALESAGDLDRAIALYRRVGEHERAGDLLVRIGEDEAALEEYRIAADRLVDTDSGHLAAGDLLVRKTGRLDLALDYYHAGWARRPAPNAVECALRLTAIYSGSGVAGPIFRLIDEADALFHSGAGTSLASRFYNEIARLAVSRLDLPEGPRDALRDLPPLGLAEDARDSLRDRALLGLAAQARRLAPSDASTAVVRDLFHPRGNWPVATIDDAEFAVKAAAARPAPTKSTLAPARFTLGTGTVSAVGFAAETEEVFVGFTSGRIARFRPATGEVETWAVADATAASIATAPDGQVVVALHLDGSGIALLSSYVRSDERPYSLAGGLSVHLIGGAPWLAQNLIAGAGGRLFGLWDGATMAVIEAMSLLTIERFDMEVVGNAPTAGFLVEADGGRKTACIAFAERNRWAMFDASGNASYAPHPQPAPRRPSDGLRSLAIAPSWLNANCFELAYADEAGAVVRLAMRADGGLTSSLSAASSPTDGYLAAAVVGRDAVVGVAPGRVVRFRVGTSRLKPTRTAACHLARPVACFWCPRMASVVVIDADGEAEVIADGR